MGFHWLAREYTDPDENMLIFSFEQLMLIFFNKWEASMPWRVYTRRGKRAQQEGVTEEKGAEVEEERL